MNAGNSETPWWLSARDLRSASIAQAPSSAEKFTDRTFRSLAYVGALAIIVLVGAILWEIGERALPAIHAYHGKFLVTSTWDIQTNTYGVLPQLWGTFYSSILALAIGGFAGFAIAIFLTQGFLPPKLAIVLRTTIEMLASIPSVVFGLWGIFVLIPAIRPVADWLHAYLPWIPFFSTPFGGPSMLPATLVLAVMILPTMASISQDALKLVPTPMKEGAYAMGATRWEATLKVVVPAALGGIFAALVLSLGRALGETMALAMLIGHARIISLSLFSPGDTLASLLASNFPEAGPDEVQALMYAALVLLAISILVNVAGTWLLELTQRKARGTDG